MATMSRQYSPQSPVMATMSRQYSPQSPAMSRQPSTGSSALSFGPGKSIGGSQAAPEQVLQSPMSRQTSESSDSRTAGQQGRPKGLAQPSGPGRSFGAGSQAVPEEAAEALTSGLLPLSTVQQLVSSDYLLLPSEEEEGLARQLALLTELGKEKAAQLGEKFKEEMPKPSKPPGSPGSPGLPGSPVVPRRELVSSQAASSAGSPKGPKGATGRPRVGKASQEKPEPQAAARGHEAEGDPITAEMASPQTAEMDQQSHSSGMAESDAAGNATFASHFLGPQEEESPHPQLTDQPLWTGARGPVAPMALDEEESSLSDLDFLS
ncbi:unnamed protein product [Cladocopium goreaui]|uniref:Uncharacterized protein n=1 Tax=Cladocopium goreaui TaxID=2562237 RepID=A0A9P1DM10_9DINO|nr:unnamed protein product [Cladocopium goreaui]